MDGFNYSPDAFSRFATVLEARAAEMGANAFAYDDQIILASVAVDEAGPLTWMLTIHADSLARLTGISTANSNMLPFTMVEAPDSPFGNLCVIKPGGVPASLAFNFLDSALEHCICIGMEHYGITPSEWNNIPHNEKVIPIEPYFEDLKNNWVSEALESNERSSLVINLPVLYTRENMEEKILSQRMEEQSHIGKPTISRAVSFGHMK